MIEELLAAFDESGANAGPEELAEILWLAARVDGGDRLPGYPQDPPYDTSDLLPRASERSSAPAADNAGPTEQFYSAADMADTPTAAVRTVDLVRVRRAASLRDPLDVMRALRPLGRPTSRNGDLAQSELDEELTVRSTIEQGLPIPVFRPRRGRWLSLALVIDTHHSMLLWQDLVAELRRVFVQTGLFRDVRTWHLSGTGPQETPRVSRAGGEPRSVHEVTDPSGHQLVLVVTDTVAGGWDHPSVQDVLRHWAAHNPVALLNVLPRRLWDRGAIRPQPHLVRAPRPAAPNASWELGHGAASRRHRHRAVLARNFAVPVLEASPNSISALARLVGGGGLWSRLACLSLSRRPDNEPRFGTPGPLPEEPAIVEDSLRRFRADASPLAQALAGYLSAVPLNLPVMNLVRQIMLPASDPGHLAEVALGGLLEPWEHEAHAGRTDLERMPFHFRAGVREALLGSQRRDEVTAVQELVRREMGAFVTERDSGPAGDFLAARGTSGGGGRRTIDRAALPFADRTIAPSPVGHPVGEFLAPHEEHPGRSIGQESVDARLHEAVDRAVDGASGLVLLIGERGSGKISATRRALQRIPANWRVWSPGPSLTLMQGAPRVGPRTVVVLENLEAHTASPDFTADGFARVMSELVENSGRAPVLILATIAPETWRSLAATATDSAGGNGSWSRLVAQAEVISLTGVRAELPPFPGEPSDARIVMIASMLDPMLAGSKIRHLGTGFLLGPRLILTAAHNLPLRAERRSIQARNKHGIITAANWAACSILWKHDTLDAALLLVEDDLVDSGTDFSTPQWAWLADGASLGSCHIAGLVPVKHDGHASGRVTGTLLATSPLPGVAYTFEPSAPVLPSHISALSGAPVLCNGFLLGFSLTMDHAERARLSVVGLSTLVNNDKGFTNACRQYLGRIPRLVSLPITAIRPDGDDTPVTGPYEHRALRVFISYVRDDPGVFEQVSILHRLLQHQGFDTRFDQDAPPHTSRNWLSRLNHELTLADVILVIGSPGYKRRMEGAEADNPNMGHEEMFRNALMHDKRSWDGMVVPVILPGGTIDDLPAYFGGLDPVVIDSLNRDGIAPLLARLPEARPSSRDAVPNQPDRAERQYALGFAVDLRPTAGTVRRHTEALGQVETLVQDILRPDEIYTEARVGDGARVDLLAIKRLDQNSLAQLPAYLLELESSLATADGSRGRRSGGGAALPLSGGVDIAVTVLPWNVKTVFPGTQVAAAAGEMLVSDAVRQRLRRSTAVMNMVLPDTLHKQLMRRTERWGQEQFEEVRIQSSGPARTVWIRHGAHHTDAEIVVMITRGVEDLRNFEREMRTRVKSYAESLQNQLEALDELDPDGSLHTELESFKHETETRLLAYLQSQQHSLSEHRLPAELPPLGLKAEGLRKFHQEYHSRLLAHIDETSQRVADRRDTALHDLVPVALPPEGHYPTPLHRSLAELKEFTGQLAGLTVKLPRQDPPPNRQPPDIEEGQN